MAPHAADDAPSAIETTESPYVLTNANGGSASQTEETYEYPPYVSRDAAYTVLNQYHSKPTKLRVACIGAGASGLCLAYKMERQLVPGSWELTLFDKNPHFGGTWYENTYPGVACDVNPLSSRVMNRFKPADRSADSFPSLYLLMGPQI
jgi:hypothetical protein